jgi:hypothetical protein
MPAKADFLPGNKMIPWMWSNFVQICKIIITFGQVERDFKTHAGEEWDEAIANINLLKTKYVSKDFPRNMKLKLTKVKNGLIEAEAFRIEANEHAAGAKRARNIADRKDNAAMALETLDKALEHLVKARSSVWAVNQMMIKEGLKPLVGLSEQMDRFIFDIKQDIIAMKQSA